MKLNKNLGDLALRSSLEGLITKSFEFIIFLTPHLAELEKETTGELSEYFYHLVGFFQ
jgi:hypothetical protein